MQPRWSIRCLNVKRSDVDLKWTWDDEIVPFSLRGMSWRVLLRHTCKRLRRTAHQSELENRHLWNIPVLSLKGLSKTAMRNALRCDARADLNTSAGRTWTAVSTRSTNIPALAFKYSLNYGVCVCVCVCGALVETSFILLTAHVFL